MRMIALCKIVGSICVRSVKRKEKKINDQRSRLQFFLFFAKRMFYLRFAYHLSVFLFFFFFCSCCDVVVLFGLRTDPKENDRKEKNTTKKSNIYKVPQLRKTVREMQFKTKRGKHFSRNGLSSHA